MTLFYVSSPALLALIVFAASVAAGLTIRPLPLAVRVSLWLGAGQAALVVFSAWQTFERSISTVACLTSIFGWMGMAVLAGLDGLNLLWWLWSRRGEGHWLLPSVYVVLRAGAHLFFVLALIWHAMLCTV